MSTYILDLPPIVAPAEHARTDVAAAASIDIATVNLTDLALAKFGPWREDTTKASRRNRESALAVKTLY